MARGEDEFKLLAEENDESESTDAARFAAIVARGRLTAAGGGDGGRMDEAAAAFDAV